MDADFFGLTVQYLIGTGLWFAVFTHLYSIYKEHRAMRVLRFGLAEELSSNFYYLNGLKDYVIKNAGSGEKFFTITPRVEMLDTVLKNPAYLSQFSDHQIPLLISLGWSQSAMISKSRNDTDKDSEAILVNMYLTSLTSVLEKLIACHDLKLTKLRQEDYLALHNQFASHLDVNKTASSEHAPLDIEKRYDEARALVIHEQVASVTFLHERMDVGYPVALIILNLLEKRGVISPDSGNAPRKVLLKAQ